MNIDPEELREEDEKLYAPDGRRVWRAGSLVYDRKELTRLFIWLYIGQFPFIFEWFCLPVMLPLFLANKGFDPGQISIFLAMLPLGALILFPVLGAWSDRTRTRWGRRRPFDFFTTPLWFLGLLMIPFVDGFIAVFLSCALIGFAAAATNVIFGLYNDIVPPELLGRFVAGLRFISALGALAFQKLLLPLFDAHPNLVWLGLAALGFIAEMLMLLMVREGDYPPPVKTKTIPQEITSYMREGFANKYVIFLWLTIGVTALGGPAISNYFNLFFTEQLDFTSAKLGNVLAVGTLIATVLFLPAGWVIDWIGTKKIWTLFAAFVGLSQIGMFVMASDPDAVRWLFYGFSAFNMMLTAALLPVMYSFIPKEKFGQLNGANQIVTRFLAFIGVLGCGYLVSFMDDYRYAFLFGGIAYAMAPVFMYIVLKQPYPFGKLKTSMHPDGRLGAKRNIPSVVPTEQGNTEQ